ncbi:MAG: ISKra4 family transposase [Phycisphaerae bacterium]|nr:ISKra4 family transposase [Phycisphaerae bacterium]
MGGRRAGPPNGRLERDGRKRGLQDELDQAVEAEVASLISPAVAAELDFEAIETRFRDRALRLAARALERQLNADRSDEVGPHLPCPCGGVARFAGRRQRTVVTVLTEIRLERAYYHCAKCGQGFCPRDRALGLVGSHLSPGLLRMVGAVGATTSFAEGAGLLRELAGVTVPPRQVERYAERLGEEAARFEREVAESPSGQVPATMYLGQDGTGVPMRKEELAGRPGKQADGSSKTREMKVCAVWTAEGKDKDGRPTRDEGSITYTAAIETAETKPTAKELAPFAQRVEREARRRGFDQALRKVAIGDGAAWLWNIADECYPDAIQILDKFHAKEHLHEVANEVFGIGSDLGRVWSEARAKEMDEGKIDSLIAAVSAHAGKSEKARLCAGYYTANRDRMDYPRFEALGLCVGSGVVEAGCKTAIGARMKRAGMRWTVRGANAIAALRCCRISGRYEDFWEWRAALRAQGA